MFFKLLKLAGVDERQDCRANDVSSWELSVSSRPSRGDALRARRAFRQKRWASDLSVQAFWASFKASKAAFHSTQSILGCIRSDALASTSSGGSRRHNWCPVRHDRLAACARRDGISTLAKFYRAHRIHLDEAERYNVDVVTAGTLVADDSETPVGSIFVIDAKDRNAVDTFARSDPYHMNSV
jgi:uncharacterized protein YciI